MGAILGTLGLGGGPGGTDVTVTNPTNAGQIADTYNNAQGSLSQQQDLLKALQAQNGLNNQNQVYNQLQGVVNGTGPNPAQAMLNQATSQNVANQAALAAGQRGAAGNVGLLARQAAQQGSNAQQQAAGQAATLQANQSLNALNQASGVANQQAGQQIQGTQNLVQNQLGEQGQILGAQQGYNSSNASIGAAQAGGQGKTSNGILGGLAQGVGNVALGLNAISGLAQGGPVPGQAGDGPESLLGSFNFASGGKVPVVLTPKEKVLSPEKAKQFASGGPLKGQTVPGEPKNPGKNDYANDTYHTNLKPGSIVIPLESLHSNEDARKFVQAVLAKKGRK